MSSGGGWKNATEDIYPHVLPGNIKTHFMKGIALSVWQNSSDETSQWTQFVKKKDYFGQKHLEQAFKKANNFWDRYEGDIKLAADLGATSFRFSFEWSRLQPTANGGFDQAAVARFHAILDTIDKLGMVPMATLHHFTHPQWFEDMGGFADEKNISHFLTYCEFTFREFGPRIPLWATFNEANVFALIGYIFGLWAPGEKLKFKKCGVVLCNLLKAHVMVYRSLKALPGGDAAQIGLVQQHIAFHPGSPRIAFWVKPVCHWMTYWFATPVITRFFTEGVFQWRTPPFNGVAFEYKDPSAVGCIDWWGINYYSRPCVAWNGKMIPMKDGEHVTDIGFRIYPEGLYESIKEASVVKVPIYITENGLADKGSNNRAEFIAGHLGQVQRAIADGYDVRGYYWWTLMDNIEWHEGFHVKFGLYEWDPTDPERAKGIHLRPGGEELAKIYKAWPDVWEELHKMACGDKHKRTEEHTDERTPSGSSFPAAIANEPKPEDSP